MQPVRALGRVLVGPNAGDVIALEQGACRLIGRHLSENETSFIDRDGNRMLDAAANQLMAEQLSGRREDKTAQPAGPRLTLSAFDRGPDVILADDAVSRAHAMLFFDPNGVGIIDLASTNGTFVNTKRVSLTMLQDGDVVCLGGSEMSIHVRPR